MTNKVVKALSDALKYLEETGDISLHFPIEEVIQHYKEGSKSQVDSCRCMARCWQGSGSKPGVQCDNQRKIGEFCGIHGSVGKARTKHTAVLGKVDPFTWEHHGRWDEPPPSHFFDRTCWSQGVDVRRLDPVDDSNNESNEEEEVDNEESNEEVDNEEVDNEEVDNEEEGNEEEGNEEVGNEEVDNEEEHDEDNEEEELDWYDSEDDMKEGVEVVKFNGRNYLMERGGSCYHENDTDLEEEIGRWDNVKNELIFHNWS